MKGKYVVFRDGVPMLRVFRTSKWARVYAQELQQRDPDHKYTSGLKPKRK